MTETLTTDHAHRWSRDNEEDTYRCEDCLATSPACVTCHRATGTALLICQPCLDAADRVLVGITDALSHYQEPQRSIVPAIRYDQDRRGGGESRLPVDTSMKPEHIEEVLLSWVAMWTELSDDPRNVEPTEYLRGHHIWAAHHAEESAWADYLREMRQLRHQARRLAGLLPQRQEGRCIYCGGDVVRDWADLEWQPREDGLSDELRCTSCRTTWPGEAHWRLANLHTIRGLPVTAPDALVTREQASAIWPDVPSATWRAWVHRDAKRAEACRTWQERLAAGYVGPEPEPERMPVQSWDVRGAALYRLDDLTRHVAARSTDSRVARRAG